MKERSNKFRINAIKTITKRIKLKVIKDTDEFKSKVDIISVGKFNENLLDLKNKVYIRDIFNNYS